MKGKGLWALVIALVLIAGGVAAYTLLMVDDDSSPEAEITEGARSGEAPWLYYVEDNTLKVIGPDEDEGTVVREGVALSSTAPDEAPYATWVAFSEGDLPSVQLYDVAADELRAIPGTAPTWKDDGSSLAVLEPDGKTSCDETSCDGRARIMLVDLSDYSTAQLGDAGEWSLVGWAGDDLVVEDESSDGSLLFISPEGETNEVNIPAEDVTSISPDGRWAVTQAEQGPELFEITSGYESDFVTSLGGPDTTYTLIDWSDDSSLVAAVVNELEQAPRIVTFVPESDPEPRDFGEFEVAGEVLFAPDDSGLVVTIVNRDETQLEASYCPIDDPHACEVLFTWQTGARILNVATPPEGDTGASSESPSPDASEASPAEGSSDDASPSVEPDPTEEGSPATEETEGT